MPDDVVQPAGEGGVLGIVRKIRETVARQREQGIVTPEEMEEMTTERFRSWVREVSIDARLRDQLLGESYDWNIDTDYLVRSHRRSPMVPVLLLAKRIVRPFVKLYTDHILNRQAQINLYFFNLLQKAVVEQVRMELEMRSLRYRLDVIEGRRKAD